MRTQSSCHPSTIRRHINGCSMHSEHRYVVRLCVFFPFLRTFLHPARRSPSANAQVKGTRKTITRCEAMCWFTIWFCGNDFLKLSAQHGTTYFQGPNYVLTFGLSTVRAGRQCMWPCSFHLLKRRAKHRPSRHRAEPPRAVGPTAENKHPSWPNLPDVWSDVPKRNTQGSITELNCPHRSLFSQILSTFCIFIHGFNSHSFLRGCVSVVDTLVAFNNKPTREQQ